MTPHETATCSIPDNGSHEKNHPDTDCGAVDRAGVGVALVLGGIVIAGKGTYDLYVTTEIAAAARAAANRYCDCKAIIQ